jgi:hypothetical protein
MRNQLSVLIPTAILAACTSPIPPSASTLTPTATELPPMAYSIEDDVPAEQAAIIESGISAAQQYLDAHVGGDIPAERRAGMTIEIVSDGAGNPEIGGVCCSGLTNGGAKPFFDVAHIDWTLPEEGLDQRVRQTKIAAHEYIHAWQNAVGCLDLYNTGRMPTWLAEGTAEYLAWQVMFGAGEADRDEQMTRILDIATGEADSGAADYDLARMDFDFRWQDYYSTIFAVERVVEENTLHSGDPIVLRTMCEGFRAGQSLDTIMAGVGLDHAAFYESFPQYMAERAGEQALFQAQFGGALKIER